MWMVMRWPSAMPAFSRTFRLASLRAFMKVVCSCGKKGLSMSLALASSTASVSRTAVLTPWLKRSPRILM